MRMKTGWKPLFVFAVIFCITATLTAQKTATYTHRNRLYNEGVDLFEKEKFAAAKFKFEEFIDLVDDPNEELRVTSEFYSGICSLYLYHKDAEYNLEAFVRRYPESPWVLKVYYELAVYNYRRKSYKKAQEWFKFVDPRDLPAADQPAFYFRRGHTYFMRDDYEGARPDLSKVKDTPSDYATPATYYYSHIAYEAGDLQTALEGFLKLRQDPGFGPIVPYYITQIYYRQGRYDEVLAYAPAFLDSADSKDIKRVEEISRLIGDSYYRGDQFEEALPYLEFYHEETHITDRSPEDFYQLGFTYYNIPDYPKALDAFSHSTDSDNELGQSSTYYMGDCYLKLDQKEYARAAFKEAAHQDHNLTLKEDALFNFAKLAFELSYNPFHEAITAFEEYLEEYPNSARQEEAYEFLLNVYMKSRNYEAALRSLDKIEHKDVRTQEAYQVVAFNRAVELYQQSKYAEAAAFFDKVNTYPVNQSLVAEAIFWKAELAYSGGDYEQAFDRYTAFITQPGSFNSGYFNEANYGAGYSLFRQKRYESATSAFRKYVDQFDSDNYVKKNDALLRLGDCYYVIKDYDQAILYYDRAASMDQAMKDYALFQKAVCLGLDGQLEKKITALDNLLTEQPNSPHTADAKFELAETYRLQDKLTTAKGYYEDILDNHVNSPYRKVSLRNLILVAIKSGRDSEAVGYWQTILADYPNDPIRTDAYRIVEDILIEQEIDIPTDLASGDDLEEKVFESARDYALSGDCNKAIEKLIRYLEKYQPALHGVEANYYLGNCYFESGNTGAALNAFNFVITQPISDYTEECLILGATINYNNEDWDQARNHYLELETIARSATNVLEAEIGLMRTYFKLGEPANAATYADKVLANTGTPENIRKTAFLWRGKVRFDTGSYDDAYYDFVEVVKLGGPEAAEAKYLMARIAFEKGAYKACEKEVFELIEKYASFNEWKYKGFVLLADTYVALEDYFQAKATLNTILENVSEPWVIDACQQRLAEIESIENPPAPPPGTDEEGNSDEVEPDESEE